jgi:hypothetical protein
MKIPGLWPLLASALGYFLVVTSIALQQLALSTSQTYLHTVPAPQDPSLSSVPTPTYTYSGAPWPHLRYPATWSMLDTFSWSLMILRSL